MVPPSEQNQRPAAEVTVRWAGDARTSEPRHRCPSHSRGGMADSQERMRGRRKLKTGGGAGRAARHSRDQSGQRLHGILTLEPPHTRLTRGNCTSLDGNHSWLSWAQWQRSLCQKPTGRALNSSCEKRNVCFPSLLESFRGRRKAGVCPFTSFRLFHSLPWNLRASKGTPTTGYDFLENYPGYLPNPTGLRFGSAVWAVCLSRLRDSLSHVPLSLRGEGCPP